MKCRNSACPTGWEINFDTPGRKWCDHCYKLRVLKKEQEYDLAVGDREFFDKHWRVATWQPDEVA